MLVGVGQYTPSDVDTGNRPLELMTVAAERALADTGSTRIAGYVDSLGVVDSFSWGTADPAAMLAPRLGLSPAETVYTHTSGTSPVELLADGSWQVRDGTIDAALIVGGEAVKSLLSGRYSGGPKQPDDTQPTRILGTDTAPRHEAEDAAQLQLPLAFYPLFEHAIRAHAGHDLDTHVAHIGRVWARFAEVAADNPYASMTTPPTAAEITTASERNRMAALPYRKLMTANISVDQAAALVLCSVATAEAAGIPRDNWVFVHSTATAADHWFVASRPELHRSPAIGAAARVVVAHAGVGIDDVAFLDVYSCFPSAVQVAANELGIALTDHTRAPTVTGGLTFAGGPGSNYVTHSVATLVERLRHAPDAVAMASAVGWYLSKHGMITLSGRPPTTPYAHHALGEVVADQPTREIVAEARGDAIIESYTVMYGKDGSPRRGIALCGLPGGGRSCAASADPDTIAGLTEGDPLGAKVTMGGAASFTFPR